MPLISYIELDGHRVLDPAPIETEAERLNVDSSWWIGKPNSFTHRRGKDPGTGHVLVTREVLDDLDLNATTHTLKFVVKRRELRGKPASLESGEATINITNLCIIRARAVLGSDFPGSNPATIFLLELEDIRGLGRLTSANKAYNLRQPNDTGFFDQTLNGASQWTWNTLLQDLWGMLPGAMGSYPGTAGLTLPEEYPTYQFWGWNAWEAINTVLRDAGLTITRSISQSGLTFTTGELKIVDAGAVNETIANRINTARSFAIADYQDIVESDTCAVPAEFNVHFPKRDYFFESGQEDEITSGDYFRNRPSHIVTVSTSSISSIQTLSDTQLPLWDSLPALYDEAGTLTNGTDLTDRATDVVTAWLNRRNLGSGDDVYHGLWPVWPEDAIHSVQWFDIGGGIQTRITNVDVDNPTPTLGDAYSLPEILEPHEPYARYFIGSVITSPIAAGSSGSVKVQYGVISGGNISWTDTAGPITETVHNFGTEEIAVGTRIRAEYHWQSKRWITKQDPSTSTGDTVKLVEITDADGSFTPADDYTLVGQNSTDCVYRARIITHDPDAVDTCVRSNVTDGADIWLKVSWSPWLQPNTQDLIGRRLLARKVQDSYTIGLNDFPFYEAAAEETQIYGIEATGASWISTKVANLFTPDFTTQVETSVTISDPANLWDNVLVVGGTEDRGIVVKVGDLLIPINLSRRAQWSEGAIAGTVDLFPTEVDENVVSTLNASEAPYNSFAAPTSMSNPYRFAAPRGTGVIGRWNPNQVGFGYEIIGVERSQPMILEIAGTDGDGQPPQLSGTTNLACWDARIVTPFETAGSLSTGIVTILGGATENVWLGFVQPSNAPNPYYLTSGSKYLAYDTGADFTPTGGTARRLYAVPRDDQTYWGKAAQNWDNTGLICDTVVINPCDDCEGNNTVTTQEFTIQLPLVAGRDPNVVIGNVIAYRLAGDGTLVCVSDYLDDKIGTVKMWTGGIGTIPPGWAIMDGTANAPGAGGSGISMVDRFVKGGISSGQSGGTREHTHQVTLVIQPHTVAETTHVHNVGVSVEPHTRDELSHHHKVLIVTANIQSSATPNLSTAQPCTSGPFNLSPSLPENGVDPEDPDQGNVCDTGTPAPWGPLDHEVTVTEMPVGFELTHQAYAVASPEQHEPPFMKLIFIERIDNGL